LFPGKLPVAVEDRDDAQKVFTTTALELHHPQSEEETERESAPPLPPKPPAG
jgi:hypothetical protein